MLYTNKSQYSYCTDYEDGNLKLQQLTDRLCPYKWKELNNNELSGPDGPDDDDTCTPSDRCVTVIEIHKKEIKSGLGQNVLLRTLVAGNHG